MPYRTIQSGEKSRLYRMARRVSPVSGVFLMALGSTVILGCILGSVRITSISASLPSMKMNTAVCFLMLGFATFGLRCQLTPYCNRVANVLSVFIFLVGALTLLEYSGEWNFGIDELLIRDRILGPSTYYPGRMAPETAWAFYFYGFALFFLKGRSDAGYWVGQVLIVLGFSFGLYQGFSYYFEIGNSIPTHTRMAAHTWVGVILGGLGLFFLYPNRGILELLSRGTIGGILVRRLLPWGIAVPPLLAWFRVVGLKHHIFSNDQGVALIATLTIIYLVGIMLRTAYELDRVDSKRVESTQLLSSIIENIPNMIFMKDAKDLRFVLFNRAGEKLLGFPRQDLMGKNDYDFFPKDQADFFTSKDREILNLTEPVDIPEEPIDTKHGKRILHTKKICLVDEKGVPQYLLGISEDITDRKEYQSLLVQSSKMSALGEMAGGIAHEINNPLSAIYGEAEELRDLATQKELDSESVAKAASRIEATTERITRIVKGLRSFARDASEEPFLPTPLYQIVEDTLSFCRERFKTQGAKLEVMNIPQTLELDCRPIQISQVLLNLLNNSFDAIQNQAEKEIRIEWQDLGAEIELRVIDNGPGIPKELQQKVFQPFFTTKSIGKGTGLGLSIAQGIVQAHKGTLVVESNAKGGAVFKLVLPRYQGDEEALKAA